MRKKSPCRRALLCAAGSILVSATGPARAGGFDDPGHDPLTIVAWADAVDNFAPGPVDVANPDGPVASFGLPEYTLGPATADPYDVVSLGDGGSITLFFPSGIGDGTGDDFAIWENGFGSPGGLFAEFAFVEVSTNGVDFVRFASETLNTVSPGAYGAVDPTLYANLAGDQPIQLGTGFDLAELAGEPLVLAGLVDLDDVAYVRVVDVVGDGSTTDVFGMPILDPYPTAFANGGFDLEAIGVLHPAPEPAIATGLGLGALVLARLGRRRCAAPR